MQSSNVEISVIVPVYNVEEYLPACIDSLLKQSDVQTEIILIDDGSTDRSGMIVDQYAKKDNRIKVIHRENRGASAARNAGLALAQGEYIAFADSDDWVKEDTLCELYRAAIQYQADAVMGAIAYCDSEGNSTDRMIRPVPKDLLNIPFPGGKCFISLLETKSYVPMPFAYIYRRAFLETIHARFEEGIICEDELWTPLILCQADKVVIVDNEFYCYRMQEKSVTHVTNIAHRLHSLFRVTDKLFEHGDRFIFNSDDGELKNWFYVNIFRLYDYASYFILMLRDSSIELPTHQLDRFETDNFELTPEPQRRCAGFYMVAKSRLTDYDDWLTSEWVSPVASQLTIGKKLMLVYNTEWGKPLPLKIEDVPADWVVTTDRRYVQQADAVVFRLPDLYLELETELNRPHGQLWVGWYFESDEETYSWLDDPEIRSMFDLWMGNREDADVHIHAGNPFVRLCEVITNYESGFRISSCLN